MPPGPPTADGADAPSACSLTSGVCCTGCAPLPRGSNGIYELIHTEIDTILKADTGRGERLADGLAGDLAGHTFGS